MISKILSLTKTRIFRWGVNTAASFTVNIGLTVGLHEVFKQPAELAYGIALVTVFLMNFFIMRYYVFVQQYKTPIVQQFLLYAGSAVSFRFSEYISFIAIHSLVGLHYLATIILVQGLAFIIKFFFYGKLFRSRSINVDLA